MKAVVIAVIDVDHIEHRHTGARKRNMVIFHGDCEGKEVGLIAKPRRSLKQQNQICMDGLAADREDDEISHAAIIFALEGSVVAEEQ